MIKRLVGVFSGTVYIQLREERLRIVHLGNYNEYDEPPYIALSDDGKQIIRAIGNDAKLIKNEYGVNVFNPFSHPRLLVNGFAMAEKIIMHGIRTVCTTKLFAPRPVVIMHPLEKLEGGITDIEYKLYNELGLGAGAIAVHIHIGPELNVHNFNLQNIVKPEIT